MNEEIKKTLLKYLSSSLDALKGAKDFAMDQIPDVLHQFLMMKAINAGIYLLMSLLIFIAGCFITLKILRWLLDSAKKHNEPELNAPYVFIALMLTLLIVIIPGYSCLNNLREILQIWITPKAYLVQMLIEFSSGNGGGCR